jgi:ketosteroid isomerase-like protein
MATRILLGAAVAGALIAGAGAGTVEARPQVRAGKAGQAAVEAEVRRLERRWLDAYEQHDAAAMDSIVADEFIITYPQGGTMAKPAIMAQIRARTEGGGPRFSTEEVIARTFGDTIVLTGILVMEGRRGKQRSRYTDTWVRRGGRWQVVASHLSGLSPN